MNIFCEKLVPFLLLVTYISLNKHISLLQICTLQIWILSFTFKLRSTKFYKTFFLAFHEWMLKAEACTIKHCLFVIYGKWTCFELVSFLLSVTYISLNKHISLLQICTVQIRILSFTFKLRSTKFYKTFFLAFHGWMLKAETCIIKHYRFVIYGKWTHFVLS